MDMATISSVFNSVIVEVANLMSCKSINLKNKQKNLPIEFNFEVDVTGNTEFF